MFPSRSKITPGSTVESTFAASSAFSLDLSSNVPLKINGVVTSARPVQISPGQTVSISVTTSQNRLAALTVPYTIDGVQSSVAFVNSSPFSVVFKSNTVGTTWWMLTAPDTHRVSYRSPVGFNTAPRELRLSAFSASSPAGGFTGPLSNIHSIPDAATKSVFFYSPLNILLATARLPEIPVAVERVRDSYFIISGLNGGLYSLSRQGVIVKLPEPSGDAVIRPMIDWLFELPYETDVPFKGSFIALGRYRAQQGRQSRAKCVSSIEDTLWIGGIGKVWKISESDFSVIASTSVSNPITGIVAITPDAAIASNSAGRLSIFTIESNGSMRETSLHTSVWMGPPLSHGDSVYSADSAAGALVRFAIDIPAGSPRDINFIPASRRIFLDGDTWIEAPKEVAQLGTGSFTIEGWWFPTDLTGGVTLFSRAWVLNNFLSLSILDSGRISLWAGHNTPGYINVVSLSSIITETNRWYHIALTRSGSSITVWVDGVSVVTATSTVSLTNADSSPFRIGSHAFEGNPFIGFMSSLRVISGTSLYSDAFTPTNTVPTAVPGTSLLLVSSSATDTSATPVTLTVLNSAGPAALPSAPSVPTVFNPNSQLTKSIISLGEFAPSYLASDGTKLYAAGHDDYVVKIIENDQSTGEIAFADVVTWVSTTSSSSMIASHFLYRTRVLENQGRKSIIPFTLPVMIGTPTEIGTPPVEIINLGEEDIDVTVPLELTSWSDGKRGGSVTSRSAFSVSARASTTPGYRRYPIVVGDVCVDYEFSVYRSTVVPRGLNIPACLIQNNVAELNLRYPAGLDSSTVNVDYGSVFRNENLYFGDDLFKSGNILSIEFPFGRETSALVATLTLAETRFHVPVTQNALLQTRHTVLGAVPGTNSYFSFSVPEDGSYYIPPTYPLVADRRITLESTTIVNVGGAFDPAQPLENIYDTSDSAATVSVLLGLMDFYIDMGAPQVVTSYFISPHKIVVPPPPTAPETPPPPTVTETPPPPAPVYRLYNVPENFTVLASNNANDWVTVATFNNIGSGWSLDTEREFSWSPTAAFRYWRFQNTTSQDDGVSITNFEFSVQARESEFMVNSVPLGPGYIPLRASDVISVTLGNSPRIYDFRQFTIAGPRIIQVHAQTGGPAKFIDYLDFGTLVEPLPRSQNLSSEFIISGLPAGMEVDLDTQASLAGVVVNGEEPSQAVRVKNGDTIRLSRTIDNLWETEIYLYQVVQDPNFATPAYIEVGIWRIQNLVVDDGAVAPSRELSLPGSAYAALPLYSFKELESVEVIQDSSSSFNIESELQSLLTRQESVTVSNNSTTHVDSYDIAIINSGLQAEMIATNKVTVDSELSADTISGATVLCNNDLSALCFNHSSLAVASNRTSAVLEFSPITAVTPLSPASTNVSQLFVNNSILSMALGLYSIAAVESIVYEASANQQRLVECEIAGLTTSPHTPTQLALDYTVAELESLTVTAINTPNETQTVERLITRQATNTAEMSTLLQIRYPSIVISSNQTNAIRIITHPAPSNVSTAIRIPTSLVRLQHSQHSTPREVAHNMSDKISSRVATILATMSVSPVDSYPYEKLQLNYHDLVTSRVRAESNDIILDSSQVVRDNNAQRALTEIDVQYIKVDDNIVSKLPVWLVAGEVVWTSENLHEHGAFLTQTAAANAAVARQHVPYVVYKIFGTEYYTYRVLKDITSICGVITQVPVYVIHGLLGGG